MLPSMIAHVANEYTYARAKPFAGSDFRAFVTLDMVKEAQTSIALWPFELTVRASVGRSHWAAVPWLAFMNPRITQVATHGVYVVALINAPDQTISLGLVHATHAVTRDFGRVKGRQILLERTDVIRKALPEFVSLFESDPISLGSPAPLVVDYEHGFAFGRTYDAMDLDEDAFLADLYRLLQAYDVLVKHGTLHNSTQGGA